MACVVLLPSSLLVGFYIYDPLMLFHKPVNRQITLSRNMRIQSPGIISRLDYDSYIIGTSMLQNTSANTASNLLGGKFANISMSGGDYAERRYALSYALKHQAKKIIYSLDSFYLNQRRGELDYPLESFSYLYSEDFRKIKFYFQVKYILCLLVWSDSSKCIGREMSLDKPKEWMSDARHAKRFGGLQKWFEASNSKQINEALNSIVISTQKTTSISFGAEKLRMEVNKAIIYLEEELVSQIREHPKTQFHLIFPPYSRARYAIWHQKYLLKAKVHEEVVRYMAGKSEELDNLYLYGYEDQNFLDNLSNYKDLGHYHWRFNQQMLKNIKDKEHLITVRNVSTYLQKAKSKALHYDLTGLGNRIRDYLDELEGN